jgi:hypothetical protein
MARSPCSNRAPCLCGLCRNGSPGVAIERAWLLFYRNGLPAGSINGKAGLGKRGLGKHKAADNNPNSYEPWLFHFNGPFRFLAELVVQSIGPNLD